MQVPLVEKSATFSDRVLRDEEWFVAFSRLPSSMEPLLPTTGRGLLAELSAEISRKSGELKSSLPTVTARAELAKLVGEMNSDYSNLIEGHKTLLRDIGRAL